MPEVALAATPSRTSRTRLTGGAAAESSLWSIFNVFVRLQCKWTMKPLTGLYNKWQIDSLKMFCDKFFTVSMYFFTSLRWKSYGRVYHSKAKKIFIKTSSKMNLPLMCACCGGWGSVNNMSACSAENIMTLFVMWMVSEWRLLGCDEGEVPGQDIELRSEIQGTTKSCFPFLQILGNSG